MDKVKKHYVHKGPGDTVETPRPGAPGPEETKENEKPIKTENIDAAIADKDKKNTDRPNVTDSRETADQTRTEGSEETAEIEETDEEVQAEAQAQTQSQEPEEGDMTESTARTMEANEDEMLFARRKIKNLEDETKKLNNEVEAYKERLLRLTSEYENFRKRTAKEKEEIGTESTVNILRDILPVIDNLERALITETDDLPGLKDGVQMTLDQFVQAMQKLGVELIPTDTGFDPEYHEAVMHETDESKGAREVAEVFLKGYKKGEKVVRHAVVKVVN